MYVNSEWPSNTVFIIDGESNKIVSNITVGNGTKGNLQSMSIDSEGTLYLTDLRNSSIYAIDTLIEERQRRNYKKDPGLR